MVAGASRVVAFALSGIVAATATPARAPIDWTGPGIAACGALHADGTTLRCADGRPFVWRGVTAFRLIDFIADGREPEAVAYLDWARRKGFTLLRVLTRIDWQDLEAFGRVSLTADEGQRHLPRLLALAAERGLYLDVVATVGSASTPYDWASHARRIAEVCAAAPARNCVYEFANEPRHGTQDVALHDMAAVDRFASAATAGFDGLVWTAGPADQDTALVPSGRFIVRHLDRAGDGWSMARRVWHLGALQVRAGVPVVSNEPIGFDEVHGDQTGRQRIVDCDVAFAFGAMARVTGTGATYHLQDGLLATLPRPVQDRCATAFVEGTRIVPDDVVLTPIAAGASGSPVAAPVDTGRASGTFAGTADRVAAVVTIDAPDGAVPRWAAGWRARHIASRDRIDVWRLTVVGR